MVAFLVTAAIGLYYQGYCPLGSVMANLLMIPLASVIFSVFLLMIPVCFIPLACKAGAEILNLLLALITGICQYFADSSVAVKMIPGWITLLFLILFFCLLQWQKKVPVLICMASMILLVFTVWFYPFTMDARIAVIRGGSSGTVTLLYADPASKSGCIVNLPDYERAAAAVDFFNYYGIERCRQIYLTNRRQMNYSSMKFLKSKIPVDRIDILEKSSYLQEKDLKRTQKHDMLNYPLAAFPDILQFAVIANERNKADGFYLFSGKQKNSMADSAEYCCRSVRTLYPELILLNGKTLKEIP